MTLCLDRMVLDDVGASPRRLAEAIHEQLGRCSGCVPVHDIARALDIVEIREARLNNIEGALVTTPERGTGSILVNANANPQRRRFSLGHELGHFLNWWHKPTLGAGFRCSRADMVSWDQRDSDRHRRQEAEANCFAIELLTPRDRLPSYLKQAPALQEVLRMASDFDISRAAAVRRYVELHDENLAVVFGKDGRFEYAIRGARFPRLSLRKNEPVALIGQPNAILPSDFELLDAADWLYQPDQQELSAQTLHQERGFSMTLLHASSPDTDDGAGIEDTYERFVGRYQDQRRWNP